MKDMKDIGSVVTIAAMFALGGCNFNGYFPESSFEDDACHQTTPTELYEFAAGDDNILTADEELSMIRGLGYDGLLFEESSYHLSFSCSTDGFTSIKVGNSRHIHHFNGDDVIAYMTTEGLEDHFSDANMP